MLFNWKDDVGQDRIKAVVSSLDQLLAINYVKSAQIVPLAQPAVPDRLRPKTPYLNSLNVHFDTLEDAVKYNDDSIHLDWGKTQFTPYRKDNTTFFVYDTDSSS